MKKFKLLPYPKHLQEKEGVLHGDLYLKNKIDGAVYDVIGEYFQGRDVPVLLSFDESFEEQEYALVIEKDEARITAAGELGLLYGATTLKQIVKQFGTELPCVEIHDKPLISFRMVQVSIGQANVRLRREWMIRFIRKMADMKITHIGLYFEWNFAFPSVPQLNNPFFTTAEDMKIYQAEAEKYHVTLVPQFALFGHSTDLLELEAFKDLRERPETDKEIEGHYDSLCPTSEKTRAFIANIVEDICNIFTSDLIHIGGDEVGHIGECSLCKARKEKIGKMGIYVDYIDYVSQLLYNRGKKTAIWGDMLQMMLDGSVFWVNADQEPQFREKAIARLKQIADRLVVFDWWYAGVNKASILFFKELGLKTVSCTSTYSCMHSFINLGQMYAVQVNGEFAIEKDCYGLLMCDWISFLGAHAEQQYVFYAAIASLAWNGNTFKDEGEEFYRAASKQVYGVDDDAFLDYINYTGLFNSPLLSLYPENERGLALRKYVFELDNPLTFYLQSKHYLSDKREEYRSLIETLNEKKERLFAILSPDEYNEFLTLPKLIHETLYEHFVLLQKAEKAYEIAAKAQYCAKEDFVSSLRDCAENVLALDGVYERVQEYAQKEYALIGNDYVAVGRLEKMRKNIRKLSSFILSMADSRRPLPCFKNIGNTLFSAPRVTEFGIRELDWSAEREEYQNYPVDNGSSWFARPFNIFENH